MSVNMLDIVSSPLHKFCGFPRKSRCFFCPLQGAPTPYKKAPFHSPSIKQRFQARATGLCKYFQETPAIADTALKDGCMGKRETCWRGGRLVHTTNPRRTTSLISIMSARMTIDMVALPLFSFLLYPLKDSPIPLPL
jgi:hypothetical protein